MKNKLTMLVIIDGWGINENEEANAAKLANTPNLDYLFGQYPDSIIHTSGLDVGLPDGQMGNSEVGHMNIGAGRIVYQEFTRISKSIADGDFFNKEEFINALENAKKNNTNLHIYGLLSDGGVHSHNTHLYALLKLCKMQNFDRVFVHCFLDGRDTPPASAENYIIELEDRMKEIGVGRVASIMGRYYAMDRDKRWERVKLAYDALVNGEGLKASSAVDAIENSYQKEEFDEFVKPTLVTDSNGEPIATIKENDSIIFFNFRTDRAREITRSLVDPEFDGFEVKHFPTYYVCMTEYDATMPNVHVAFKPQTFKNKFGEYISSLGYSQLRIAETEKYAHVTFFFDGQEEVDYPGKTVKKIDSPKVATYDLQPEMSAYEVTDTVVDYIRKNETDVIILNYANCDMVGHTGSLEAAIKAVEAVDECVGKVAAEVLKVDGQLVIIADHGNCEQMIDYNTGEPHTAHTTNPVPIILVTNNKELKIAEGKLCDIAPTLLDLMGVDKPAEMTGKSLIIR